MTPWLCSGEIWDYIEQCFEDIFAKLIPGRSRISAEQWQLILEELSRAKGDIVHIMTVKLSNWTELPWYLCILAHPLVSVARQGAVKIMQMFDRHTHTHTLMHIIVSV